MPDLPTTLTILAVVFAGFWMAFIPSDYDIGEMILLAIAQVECSEDCMMQKLQVVSVYKSAGALMGIVGIVALFRSD